MPLLKSDSKSDENEIKKIINDNVATSMKTQPSFADILKLNGCSTLKLGSVGSKIRKQLLNEAKTGDLTAEEVMPRAYYLIGQFLGISDVKTFDDRVIENTDNKVDSIREKGFNATLPYTGSGVLFGQAGRNIIGGVNYYSTQLGEGQIEWKNSKVFFVENGLRIDETEQFIHYNHVDYVDYSLKSDRKGLLAFKRNAITFIMKNGEQIIMRVLAEELDAIKYWIEADMKKTEVSNNADDDILIKYFDMYEKGLITREEFDLKKEELYNKIDDNSPLKSDHIQKNQPLFCSQCGNKIEEGSNFCSKCGNKVNNI